MPDFSQPVSFEFIFWTVVAILALTAMGIYMVKKVKK